MTTSAHEMHEPGTRAAAAALKSKVSDVLSSPYVRGAAVLGILFFGEPLSFARIVCLVLIVCGILGLKFLVGEGAN